jgi:hypothetical protein
VRQQAALIGQRQFHLRRRPVGFAQEGQREAVRIQHGVRFLLPAIAAEGLLEVAGGVEQADADQRHAQVRGGLEMVPGEDAEPARVLGKD